MKKVPVFFLFALCPLIPAASNFSYGLILGFAFLWFLGSGILFREIVLKVGLGEASIYIELVSIAASATFFIIILGAILPVITTSLTFYIYLSAFCYLLIISIDGFFDLNRASSPLLVFIPFMILFSAFREILGCGTLTLPSRQGLIILQILPDFSQWGLGFWATSGGAFILLGIITWAFKFVHRKIQSLGRYS